MCESDDERGHEEESRHERPKVPTLPQSKGETSGGTNQRQQPQTREWSSHGKFAFLPFVRSNGVVATPGLGLDILSSGFAQMLSTHATQYTPTVFFLPTSQTL